jgi:energy-coupling factor transporter ATP-binding protein EcfA2
MYIETVRIKNVRCFGDVTLDLSSCAGVSRQPKKFAVIVGDNGAGKTSLLRCIAVGLCDEDGAAALMRDTYGDWRRSGLSASDESYIQIGLRHRGELLSLRTRFELSRSGWEKVRQDDDMSGQFPWDAVFVCGYGGNRRATGRYNYEEYSAADAVYSLFNYDYGLQDPELAIRRIAGMGTAAQETANRTCEMIRNVLMLKKGAVRLQRRRGLRVRGEWGVGTLGTLGDGYQATLTWMLDLLSWAMLAGRSATSRFQGIVLLDELEQYLHPKWQRAIICLLRKTFPNLQFITTTHSPLCAAGVTDMPGESAILYRLFWGGKRVVQGEPDSAMRGWRYDQILMSPAFEMTPPRGEDTQAQIETLRELYLKKKTTRKEKAKFQRLVKKLRETAPSAAEGERQARVQWELRDELRKLNQKLASRTRKA